MAKHTPEEKRKQELIDELIKDYNGPELFWGESGLFSGFLIVVRFTQRNIACNSAVSTAKTATLITPMKFANWGNRNVPRKAPFGYDKCGYDVKSTDLWNGSE